MKHPTLCLRSVPIFLCLAIMGCDGAGSQGLASIHADQGSRVGGEYLATEHRITVDLASNAIEQRFREVIEKCAADAEFKCTILSSQLASRDDMSASIVARLLPSGIEGLVEIASRDGLIAQRSTSVEDLAKPVIDA